MLSKARHYTKNPFRTQDRKVARFVVEKRFKEENSNEPKKT